MKSKKRVTRSIRVSEHVWDKFKHHAVDSHLSVSELFEKVALSSYMKDIEKDLIMSSSKI